MDFSAINPSLLAAGYNDGTVAFFDIRSRGQDPVYETRNYHTGTVWDLQWVNLGKDIGERLQSVGVEGRVNSWAIKKDLDVTEIMRLKRTGRGGEHADSMVSSDFGGLCMDAYPNDNNMYGSSGIIMSCCNCFVFRKVI